MMVSRVWCLWYVLSTVLCIALSENIENTEEYRYIKTGLLKDSAYDIIGHPMNCLVSNSACY